MQDPLETPITESMLFGTKEPEHWQADLREALNALRAMVSRYASQDQWEVPLECDTEARRVLDKHGINWRDEPKADSEE